MNDWDRDNLNFILNLKSEDDWEEWMANVSEEDLFYALELVRTGIVENQMEMMKLQEEQESLEDLDCSEALTIINRVKKGAL